MTAVWDLRDPFAAARREAGALLGDFDDEAIALVLRYHDVRGAAADHATFTSDTPFRVPIPSEESVRQVRQLPIETDPPSHARYRAVVREIFSRPRKPGFVRAIEQLVEEMVASVADGAAFDVVNAFALPLQSKALAILLGMPTEDAELWATWGQHIFHSDDALDEQKGGELDRYLRQQFERAERSPGDDFFSALTSVSIDDQPLSLDEKLGFANLAFAGGRDTVINTVSFALAHLAACPSDRQRIRKNPELARSAAEEVVRVVSPLTIIGRTCTRNTRVGDVGVQAGQRAALCWASANRDEQVFAEPSRVDIGRRPNPHVGFGAAHHSCLGASHARLLLRSLLGRVAASVDDMTITEIEPHYETWPAYRRQTGYDRLMLTMTRGETA